MRRAVDDEIGIRSTSLFLSALRDFERDALVLELNYLFHTTKNRVFSSLHELLARN